MFVGVSMNPAEISQYISHISACPLFHGVSSTELVSLLSHPGCSLLECPAGDMLPSDGMLVLLSGRVQIQKPASDGRCLLMREASPPQAINAASALCHSSMSRLIASADCTAVHITGEALSSAIANGNVFALNMAKFLAEKIEFLNKRIASLGGYTAASRLIMYLDENAVEINGIRSVTLPCSLTDFAEYLGVGRASLYRTLDTMTADGTISRKGRTITIHK